MKLLACQHARDTYMSAYAFTHNKINIWSLLCSVNFMVYCLTLVVMHSQLHCSLNSCPPKWMNLIMNDSLNRWINQRLSASLIPDLSHPAGSERMYFPSAMMSVGAAVDHDWVHIPSLSTELSLNNPRQHHSIAVDQQSALSVHSHHHCWTKTKSSPKVTTIELKVK